MIIYKITNTINDKVYIGQSSKRSNLRFNNHRYDLNHNIHWSTHLQRAWNKYGSKAFTFEVIETILCDSILDNRECYWIAFYNATDAKFGYNTDKGGRKNKGMSTLGREKLRIRMLGNTHTKGKKHNLTEEQRLIKSEQTRQYNLKRGAHSEETKKKISEALSGPKSLNWNKPGVNRKEVLCINTGKIYNSTVSAQKDLGIDRKSIREVCMGKKESVSGYSFRFTGAINVD